MSPDSNKWLIDWLIESSSSTSVMSELTAGLDEYFWGIDYALALACSLILSLQLDYCNVVLYGAPASSIQKLQHMQNTTRRIVLQAPKWSSAGQCWNNCSGCHFSRSPFGRQILSDSSDDYWKLTTFSCISVLTNSAVTVFNLVFTLHTFYDYCNASQSGFVYRGH